MVPLSNDDLQTNEEALQLVEQEHGPLLTAAMDRRTRRFKQALLEAETSKWKREGKKTFYMTLDSEGKPVGTGKKAWIAEINKLAKGLDPSCTHIRKQTYEDMCVFKDRLSDNFEYSGDLNEDHLRALAGKAVTKIRTKLISMIRRGEEQPLNIDEGIWTRLQKIAFSRQRDERTEHGRYANACRKTLGRTGSLGVDGIRQRLREQYGRSPDPDEVVVEMQRHKGFGREEHGKSISEKVYKKDFSQPCHQSWRSENNTSEGVRERVQLVERHEREV